MQSKERPSATRIPHFLATRIISEAESFNKGVPEKEELAEAISEIGNPNTDRGSILYQKFGVIDPEWVLATTGFVDVNEEGILDPLEVEFPEKSGWLWTFCAVEITNDVTQPNLVLSIRG